MKNCAKRSKKGLSVWELRKRANRREDQAYRLEEAAANDLRRLAKRYGREAKITKPLNFGWWCITIGPIEIELWVGGRKNPLARVNVRKTPQAVATEIFERTSFENLKKWLIERLSGCSNTKLAQFEKSLAGNAKLLWRDETTRVYQVIGTDATLIIDDSDQLIRFGCLTHSSHKTTTPDEFRETLAAMVGKGWIRNGL